MRTWQWQHRETAPFIAFIIITSLHSLLHVRRLVKMSQLKDLRVFHDCVPPGNIQLNLFQVAHCSFPQSDWPPRGDNEGHRLVYNYCFWGDGGWWLYVFFSGFLSQLIKLIEQLSLKVTCKLCELALPQSVLLSHGSLFSAYVFYKHLSIHSYICISLREISWMGFPAPHVLSMHRP